MNGTISEGELLSMIAGSFVSLTISLLNTIPAFKSKWELMSKTQKQALNVLLLFVVVVVVYSISCVTDGWVLIDCDATGILQLLFLYLIAIISNSATYTTFKDIFDSLMGVLYGDK